MSSFGMYMLLFMYVALFNVDLRPEIQWKLLMTLNASLSNVLTGDLNAGVRLRATEHTDSERRRAAI